MLAAPLLADFQQVCTGALRNMPQAHMKMQEQWIFQTEIQLAVINLELPEYVQSDIFNQIINQT